jgi:hypothetical protein
LRAGAAGWLRPRFDGVKIISDVEIVAAAADGDGVEVKFAERDPRVFDRVVLATGYKFDVARLGMLAPELRSSIACRAGSPLLSAGFESSARGLHFVGAAAVASLGPLMRFIAGTGFTGRRLADSIAGSHVLTRPRLRGRVEYDLTA